MNLRRTGAQCLARAARSGAGMVLALLLIGIAGCDSPSRDGVALAWPQWRGPQADGVSHRVPVPIRWPEGDGQVRWRAPVLGSGTSSPVSSGGLVFLTTSWPVDESHPTGPRQRAAQAWNLVSGEERWRTEVVITPSEKHHALNSAAGPTPATDGERLYVYFGSHLAALDLSPGGAGEVLWVQEVAPDYAEYSRYGAASSPVVVPGAVIVVQDKEFARNGDVGWIAAFDAASGTRLWRTEWEHTCCSYSTPIVAERDGALEILYAHSGEIAGYDARDGAKLWSFEYPMLQMVSTPLYVLTEGGEERLYVLGGADNRRGNVGLRLRGAGSATTIESLWQGERLVPQASSPLFWQGRIYSVTLQGVVVAWDPENGEVLWRMRTGRGRNHASLIAAQDRLYVSSSSGAVAVVDLAENLEPSQRLLALNELGEPGTSASPALAGGCFLQRSETSLWCVEVAGVSP